ncbi:MAG TPA: YihY/virulence factor BrkB family protein, partial [Acidimicrobiales bacterium]|nr:YihY/virulence factor BrkB family protein [Acidimicrobiales bacterium]
GGALAVQLTYVMFVTIFPLLLLLITVLGVVLADHPWARQHVVNSAVGQFPIVGQQLADNIHALKRNSMFGLVVGALGLAYGSTGLAQTGLFAMGQIWDIPMAFRPSFVARLLRSVLFLALLAVGLVVTTALSGFGTFGKHDVWLGYLAEVVAAVLNVLLYLGAFRILTPRQVAFRSLLPGAVVGGVAWSALQALGGYVVGHDLKGSSAIYGSFGLVLGLLAWLYLGARLTLYSAEVNAVLKGRLWPRAMVQPPLTEADQRSMELQTLENQRHHLQEVSTSFRQRPMTEDEFRERDYELEDPSVPERRS